MDKNSKKTDKIKNKDIHRGYNYRKDAPGAIAGINTPGIEIPTVIPPVPNRAWTAMAAGRDIEELTEEERRELYIGQDNFL